MTFRALALAAILAAFAGFLLGWSRSDSAFVVLLIAFFITVASLRLAGEKL